MDDAADGAPAFADRRRGARRDGAEALAARLMSRLTEIQREARVPQVALTGGRIATKAYQRLGLEGRSSAVDWSRVGLWWGDERFVAADDEDRNARQALTALSPLPLDLERVHPMPAAGDGLDLDSAAEAYEGVRECPLGESVRAGVPGRRPCACGTARSA